MALPAGSAHAEESLIPADMVYVGQGPSVMGIDKEQPTDSGKKLTPYERRMKTPWSAEALNDEGPAHMVILDSYLIDKYEVSNNRRWRRDWPWIPRTLSSLSCAR